MRTGQIRNTGLKASVICHYARKDRIFMMVDVSVCFNQAEYGWPKALCFLKQKQIALI